MSFSIDMSRAISNIRDHVDETVRGTLFGVSSRIIKATPVGDPSLWLYNKGTKEAPNYVDYLGYHGSADGYVGGSLRGAWNASIGAPDETKTGAVDSAGTGTITAMRTIVNGVNIGDNFYLTNPLPYAYRVENGWSSQAPAGMVRVAVAETQAVLNSL